jgi:hypothetical protein
VSNFGVASFCSKIRHPCYAQFISKALGSFSLRFQSRTLLAKSSNKKLTDEKLGPH